MLVKNPQTSWDCAVSEASEVYKHRMVSIWYDQEIGVPLELYYQYAH